MSRSIFMKVMFVVPLIATLQVAACGSETPEPSQTSTGGAAAPVNTTAGDTTQRESPSGESNKVAPAGCGTPAACCHAEGCIWDTQPTPHCICI